jgi:hypothetical protein
VCMCENISHSCNNKFTFSGGRDGIASATRFLASRLRMRCACVAYFVVFFNVQQELYLNLFCGMYFS